MGALPRIEYIPYFHWRTQLISVRPYEGGVVLGFFGSKKSVADLPVRKTVKVMPRETLRSIAGREYGDETQWEVIFTKNKWRFDGADPLTIYPGMDLDIPEIEGQ